MFYISEQVSKNHLYVLTMYDVTGMRELHNFVPKLFLFILNISSME
jgi:hypothetical protein